MNKPSKNKFAGSILIVLLAICGMTGAIALHAHLESNSEKLVPGQVLGFYISGILGNPGEAPPMNVQDPDSTLPESRGWPVPIRKDGTISLPSIHPVFVQGKSVREVRHLVNAKYRAGKEPILPENVSIRVCIYPEGESWERIRFREYLLNYVPNLLGL